MNIEHYKTLSNTFEVSDHAIESPFKWLWAHGSWAQIQLWHKIRIPIGAKNGTNNN
jgi:hypothetical protein